ncbi:MAG: transcriptional regulator [Thermobacillus sp. ZCTH02-B1]|uniref:GbsR/MarR family transcriptional regulator n=1 Tax=Thermobacillus sp. ZCTH02-B1 TaxID=1858795 RepID=UPI000B57621C|nr:GbsR/MarR family transcriptional regulator [Thermobacillus sp. ZCTH02-B1]OUM94258.1 MAG: transcriptional regulator [Thermobacillus sp. ZCTH02-B1]
MISHEGLSDQQKARIEKARHRVIDSIGKNMNLYGITLSVGHLYGHIYFKEHPVSLDEMAAEMGMSKTSVSTGMRMLTDLKMVNKVWSKGSRKDLYEVEMDWHQTFADYFAIKWRKSIEQNVQALTRSLAELKEMLTEDGDNETLVRVVSTDIRKIQSALAYYRWLTRLIDALETGEIFKYIPKEAESEDTK